MGMRRIFGSCCKQKGSRQINPLFHGRRGMGIPQVQLGGKFNQYRWSQCCCFCCGGCFFCIVVIVIANDIYVVEFPYQEVLPAHKRGLFDVANCCRVQPGTKRHELSRCLRLRLRHQTGCNKAVVLTILVLCRSSSSIGRSIGAALGLATTSRLRLDLNLPHSSGEFEGIVQVNEHATGERHVQKVSKVVFALLLPSATSSTVGACLDFGCVQWKAVVKESVHSVVPTEMGNRFRSDRNKQRRRFVRVWYGRGRGRWRGRNDCCLVKGGNGSNRNRYRFRSKRMVPTVGVVVVVAATGSSFASSPCYIVHILFYGYGSVVVASSNRRFGSPRGCCC
mmetsp:Transcript_25617/g.53966  ORF Transcript_25617/g.53966 Transcript_25617/m.53966 type:complete len:336 (-) Transcript_25617:356-1363(-)